MESVLVAPVPNFGVSDWRLVIISLGILMSIRWLYVALERTV